MASVKRTAAMAGSLFALVSSVWAASSSTNTSFVVGQVIITDPRIVKLDGTYELSKDDRTLQLAITQDEKGDLVSSATLLIQGNGQVNVVGPFQLGGKLQLTGNRNLRFDLGGRGVDDDQDDDGINDNDDVDDDNDGINDDVDGDDDHPNSGSNSGSGSVAVVRQHGGDDPPGDDNGGLNSGSDDPAGDDDHDGLSNSDDTDDDNDGLDDSVDNDDDNDGIDDSSEHHSGSGRSEAFRLRGTFDGSMFQVTVDLKGFGGARTFSTPVSAQDSNHTITIADAVSSGDSSKLTSSRSITLPFSSTQLPAVQQNRGTSVRFAIKSSGFGLDLRGTSTDNTSFNASSVKLKLGAGNLTLDPSSVTVTQSTLTTP